MALLGRNLCRISYKVPIHCRAMSAENDVLFDSINGNGVITLNRPKALNALNLSMINKIYPKLKEWEREKKFVLVKGAGGKAFCAGGDVRAVTSGGYKGDSSLGQEFFRKEYTVNGIIGTYSIPYVALIDGIVMGGGVGLSVHGPYRVATERSMFAMPETAIGLFPDVGGSYFLPRLGGKLGLYLALTGVRLKGSDLLKAGIATHLVDSNSLEDLEKTLLDCGNETEIKDVLKKFGVKESEFSLEPHIGKINECFSGETIEEIYARLEKDGSEWAKVTVKTLNSMSPTSLKVTLQQLKLGAKMNLLECLQMEYRICVNCLNNKDFFEGVRALLVDKDKNPKWDPSSISAVTDEHVKSYFSKLADDEELKHKL